ncbi:MarR family transcriptional regulator [Aliiruegeria sabulilitoris]|uniref:MarR family transcriptional regulator n=1 Tax=Aliiruegeria sabulilitoris TaxID=1510458 RepID=UPI00082E9E01|nr:MarR family transcriptional regulator [Aliiruegeria sabulilitoris]NDR57657.1 MarR family transcriptional regulator [Pseudoruegeria sp. M32A2M]
MVSPDESLGRSVTDFLRLVPVHISPILYRIEYNGRMLTESEVMVVMLLERLGPLSPTRISRGLNMQKGSLTSVLRRLEGLGVTARTDNPEDDRSYIAELTPQGAAFARRFEADRQEKLRDLFTAMAPNDRRLAAEGLDLLTGYFREVEEKEMAATLDDHAPVLNWYHAASPEDRKEYDAFGPWLTEVKAEEDMPPRFRAFYSENKDADFLLKLPKNADRRQLRPGMDLYDAVFVVDKEGVAVIRLEDGGVTRTYAAWDDVAAVGSYGDKLQGVWTLYLRDGTRSTLSFNRVSTDLMDKVTDFVRARLRGDRGSTALPDITLPPIEITDADLFFGSALLEIRRRSEDDVSPIHFEPEGQRCFDVSGDRQVSTGVLLLDTPSELVIVNRDRPSHRRGEAWHASNDIFIPYSRVTHFSLIAAPNNQKGYFHTLVLRLDGQAIEQPCLQIPTAVMEVLRARCGAAM